MSAPDWLGSEHWNDKFGRVMLVGFHPHDAALAFVMKAIDDDAPRDSDLVSVERSELRPLPDRTWPYLGFITKELSDSCSAPWAAKHGIEERPRGSGQWFYTWRAGRVHRDDFATMHDEDYNKMYAAELAKHGIVGLAAPVLPITVHKGTAVGRTAFSVLEDRFLKEEK